VAASRHLATPPTQPLAVKNNAYFQNFYLLGDVDDNSLVLSLGNANLNILCGYIWSSSEMLITDQFVFLEI
jgi:hypothetical protein